MTTPDVYKAINAVQRAIGSTGISKDRRNAQQGYNFRGIDDVYNSLNPLLAEAGLCILPRMLERTCEERQSAKGGALFYVTVAAEFDFVAASDGSRHVVKTYGEAMDSADKATNKAMSAAYKYACMQAFAIPTEGDNDADQHTHEVAPRVTPAALRAAEESLRDAATMGSAELKATFDGLPKSAERSALWKRIGPELKTLAAEADKAATEIR